MSKEDHTEYMRKMDEIITRSEEINRLLDEIAAIVDKDPERRNSYKKACERITAMWQRLMAESKKKQSFTYNPNLFKYDFGDKK